MFRLFLNIPSGMPLPLDRMEGAIQAVFNRVQGARGEDDSGAETRLERSNGPVEGEDYELSITFLEDRPIRELNRAYLGHDWVPDVLSFSFTDPPPLGDIYVGFEQARRQAEEEGVSFEEELIRLCVHGTLHILGFDHPEQEDERAASAQYRIQEEIVQQVMSSPAYHPDPT
jgi:probable rRNA maturation factor